MIPERMLQKGRSANQTFLDDEALYYRFRNSDYARDANFKSNLGSVIDFPTDFGVRVPNQSVNRAWPDGEPEDVLLPTFLDWGIAAFQVKDIPTPISTFDKGTIASTFEFRPLHDPLPENYYHTELAAYKEGIRVEKINSKEVKQKWKFELSRRLTIHKKPDA